MSYRGQQSIQASTRPSLTVNAMSFSNIATLSGVGQVVDGHTVAANDVIWLNAQTTATQNGPYLAVAGTWQRLTGYESGVNVAGLSIYIQSSSSPSNNNNNIYQVVAASAFKAALGFESCVATLVSTADPVTSVPDFTPLTTTQTLAFKASGTAGAFVIPNRYQISSSQTTTTNYNLPSVTAANNGQLISVQNSSTALHTVTGTINGVAATVLNIFPGDDIDFIASSSNSGFILGGN